MNDRDWLALLKTANHEFGSRLSTVTDWDAPTPDIGWSVRDLAAHVIEEQQWVPYLLSGSTLSQAKRKLAPLGDDLFAEWRLYSLGAGVAWHNVAPGTIVDLSRDRVPAEDYLRELVSDVTIHTWDLARAIGASEELDPALIDAVWTVFEPQQETLAASGLYAAPVPLPDDAPLQSRLLAVTGRDDRIAA